MAIERDGYNGPIIFICDEGTCKNTCSTGLEDWDDAMIEFRAVGWRAIKDGEGWKHYCTSHRSR